MQKTGVTSAPREHSETGPRGKNRTDGPPPEIESEGGDHLESVHGPSAKVPRRTKKHFEDVSLPTSIQDQNGEQTLAMKRVNRGKREVQVKSRSNTWDSDQLIPSAARRQAGSAPDQSHVAEQEGTVNPVGEMTEMLTDETMETEHGMN